MGWSADRFERVRLMVTLDTIAMVVQGALAAAAAFSAPALMIIALATLTSISTASYDPTARATVPDVVGEEHLAAANSVQAAIENLTIIVGPGDRRRVAAHRPGPGGLRHQRGDVRVLGAGGQPHPRAQPAG